MGSELLSRLPQPRDPQTVFQRMVEFATTRLLDNGLSPPTICVVVDGDNLPFCPDLLAKGDEGGRQAARELAVSIRKILKLQNRPEIPIKIRVFANSRGLSRALIRCGIIRSTSCFERFIDGFSRAPESTYWSVPFGKESADWKIREEVISNLRHPDTFVVLCIGDDAGYARFFEDLFYKNSEQFGRLWIGQGYPLHADVCKTKVQILDSSVFESVFHHEKLACDRPSTSSSM